MSWRSVVKKVVPGTVLRTVVGTFGLEGLIRLPKAGSEGRVLTPEDAAHFRPVLDAWRPADRAPVTTMRWVVTEWCNYTCSYCPQNHDRYAPFGEGYTAHAFDNHPVEKWADAFRRHFRERRLSMVITGGEPFLDRPGMTAMLAALTAMDTVECIRFDTNATFDPKFYDGIDKSRVVLMCTFHPGQTDEASFFKRVDRLREHGFTIDMINYVATRENLLRYPELKARFAAEGIALHPNPLWNSEGYYHPEDLDFLRRELPEADFGYRTGLVSPKGKKCLYPTLGYQMDSRGHIHTGCFPGDAFDFLGPAFPESPAGPVYCPADKCTCTDMYSFLGEVNRNETINPLRLYAQQLLERP